ncbi:MAG TPA: TetR/AcrR family transcriptional regulator [Anaerolineaceae bacterium]|nr:TetR/AcrR family transcriptional regulator [Anaerolineaceae bacterium]
MADKRIHPVRVHNAERARKAFLDTAEEEFANSGYAGARVDEIARRAGYNKGLLFRYFHDKLNLYKEVLKHADQETNELRAKVLAPLFTDQRITSDPKRFRSFLETMIRANFDYLVSHPRILRILLWEMADRWKTYASISPEFSQNEIEPFLWVCREAVNAGILKSDFAPFIQLTITQPICQIYLAYLPLFQISFPNQDLTSPDSLEKARDFIVNLILSGIINDPDQQQVKSEV